MRRFYSREVLSGTGPIGSVVKMRVPGSISRATALNRPVSAASQRIDPVKSDVSAALNRPVDEPGRLPVGRKSDRRHFQHCAPPPRRRFDGHLF